MYTTYRETVEWVIDNWRRHWRMSGEEPIMIREPFWADVGGKWLRIKGPWT